MELKKWDVIGFDGQILGGVEEVDHNEAIQLAYQIYGSAVYDVELHEEGN